MTFIQYLILFSLVYLYVYALIGRICKCIEHCATARAYSKLKLANKCQAIFEKNWIVKKGNFNKHHSR